MPKKAVQLLGLPSKSVALVMDPDDLDGAVYCRSDSNGEDLEGWVCPLVGVTWWAAIWVTGVQPMLTSELSHEVCMSMAS